MNTEHAGRQKAEEGFPRLGQATPQGQKGYPKDEGSILQKEKLPSSKPIEDLGRPGSTGSVQGSQEDMKRHLGLEEQRGPLHLYHLGISLQQALLL